MAYEVTCRSCKNKTWARNIVQLLDSTDVSGRFICSHCQSTDTYIFTVSALQEKGETWERWIKGAIRIPSDYETYSPFVFLIAYSEDAEASDLQFNYYKDLRPQGGRLKQGAAPGGAPALHVNDLFTIILHLVSLNIL